MERTLLTPTTYETEKRFDDGSSLRRRYAVSPLSLFIKRTFDLVAAVIGVILMSPLFIYISVSLRRHEKGAPVIFSQKRVGRAGKEFTLYKFRTMTVDAEADGEARLCAENDSRITDFGRFLRSHHLDELPQLWNVLRGDMSFVGYRPERKVFVDRIIEAGGDYAQLFKTRPGLFSYATLYNGYTDTLEKMLTRLHMDLDYLHSRTIFTDIKVIALTGWSIISGKKF